MHELPPLPPGGEEQLRLLLEDFRHHHVARRARRRRIRSASLLTAGIILTFTLQALLMDGDHRRPSTGSSPRDTPSVAEQSSPHHEEILAPPESQRSRIVTAIAPTPGRVAILHTMDTDPGRTSLAPSRPTLTVRLRGGDGSGIRRASDEEALELLAQSGRRTGIIRIDGRTFLADEVRSPASSP